MTATNNTPKWIDLRSNGKLHAKLEKNTLRLEIVRSGWLTVYDLQKTDKTGRAVVVESRSVNQQDKS